MRRTNLALLNSSATLCRAIYGYDNASRLASVSDGTNMATNSYLANSSLVGQIAFKQSGTTRMTTSKQYDFLNRLGSISSTPSNAFAYQYNAASQRTMNRLWDGSYWRYGYDALGQVISGNKFWVDETPVAGQQFDYAFDTIGNRTQAQAGGNQNGANLRLANYTNNTLNQITSRGVPGYVDVMGDALGTNSVTVNGLTAYRKIEYFRQQLAVTNTSAAVWQGVTNASPGQTSVTGHLYVPKNPETCAYDADGNLLSDGRWTYAWDGENRLLSMTSLSSAPSGSLLQLLFTYDYQGRRIQKMVSTKNGSCYVGEYTNNYAYDGWNCIAILTSSFNLLNSFLWGSDVSGSLQGAGGVGGLLAENIVGNGVQFVAYDGNGNVAALVNATNGITSANYDYGPFGELIRATGPMAKLNPFRFSTKYDDDESDFLYYGRRYYNPSTGRWPSRDPMEELGSILITQDVVDEDAESENDGSPYRFANNNPITETDTLGLWPSSSPFLGFLINGHPIPLTHQNANHASLPTGSLDMIMIDGATKFVDTFQGTQDSYMHAMKAPGQDGGIAKQRANAFVKEHLIAAESELCGCQGDRDKALFDFGMALHTVQDSTSPAHNSPQNEPKTWDGLSHWIKALRHVKHEDFDPGPGSALYRATADFWKYFQCINSAPPLPDNFFTWGTDQNPRRK